MTIAQLRSLILAGNLIAGGGLVYAGGGYLWNLLLPPKAPKEVKIDKKNVTVKKRGQKPPRERFGNTWDLPVVPDMQPREAVAGVTPDQGPTGMTPEQAERLLDLAFDLKMTSPNWDNLYRSYATVILKQGNNQPALIGVRDRIQGYLVKRILNAEVIFEVQGVEAPLRFKEGGPNKFDAPAGAGAGAAAAAPGGNPFAGRGGVPSGDLPFVSKAKKVSEVEWHVSGDEARWIETNYAQLMREIDVRPHRTADGAIDGMELREVDPQSLPAKRGFKGGDVIKSVNGEPVTDMGKLPEIMAKQRGKKKLVIVYSRKGIDQTITYTLP